MLTEFKMDCLLHSLRLKPSCWIRLVCPSLKVMFIMDPNFVKHAKQASFSSSWLDQLAHALKLIIIVCTPYGVSERLLFSFPLLCACIPPWLAFLPENHAWHLLFLSTTQSIIPYASSRNNRNFAPSIWPFDHVFSKEILLRTSRLYYWTLTSAYMSFPMPI